MKPVALYMRVALPKQCDSLLGDAVDTSDSGDHPNFISYGHLSIHSLIALKIAFRYGRGRDRWKVRCVFVGIGIREVRLHIVGVYPLTGCNRLYGMPDWTAVFDDLFTC